MAEARREKAADLKRKASMIERDHAKAAAAAAAAAEPAARAANGRAAAPAPPGKGGGRLRVRTPATPELDGEQRLEDACNDFFTGDSRSNACLGRLSRPPETFLFAAQATATTMRSRAQRTMCPSARGSARRWTASRPSQ